MASDNNREANAAAATEEAAASISAAIRRAEGALESVRKALKQGRLEDVGASAVAAASALLREGEALVAESQTLAAAEAQLRGAVRRSPLTSLGAAFAAGLIIALLTKS